MTNEKDVYGPATDGIDHVNVYSRGRTPEGRLLSNFAPTPFTLHGVTFASVEGFYQSMRFDDDPTRRRVAGTAGGEAKAWGNRSGKRPGDPVRAWDGRVVAFKGDEFYAQVGDGIRARVAQNPAVAAALVATENLPLTHYYVRGRRVIVPRGKDVLCDCLTELRAELRDAAAVRQALERQLARLTAPTAAGVG